MMYKQYSYPDEASGDGQLDYWMAYWEKVSLEDLLAQVPKSEYRPAVDQYMPREGLVLEAGCGLGQWLVYLYSLGVRAHGVDFEVKALRDLKREFLDVLVCTADVVHLPYADASFSACLSFGVIEHLEFHLQDAVREMHRVLVPGGICLVSVPFMNLLKKLMLPKRLQEAGRPARFYQYVFTEEAILRTLRENGFDIVDVRLVGRNVGIEHRSNWLRQMARRPGYSGLHRRRSPVRIAYDVILTILPKGLSGHMILLICRK